MNTHQQHSNIVCKTSKIYDNVLVDMKEMHRSMFNGERKTPFIRKTFHYRYFSRKITKEFMDKIISTTKHILNDNGFRDSALNVNIKTFIRKNIIFQQVNTLQKNVDRYYQLWLQYKLKTNSNYIYVIYYVLLSNTLRLNTLVNITNPPKEGDVVILTDYDEITLWYRFYGIGNCDMIIVTIPI